MSLNANLKCFCAICVGANIYVFCMSVIRIKEPLIVDLFSTTSWPRRSKQNLYCLLCLFSAPPVDQVERGNQREIWGGSSRLPPGGDCDCRDDRKFLTKINAEITER